MRLFVSLSSAALALGLWAGAAQAAGPSPGQGPWQACPNDSVVCAGQLGQDLNPTNQTFDCMTKNGRAGHGLQNGNNARAHCWAD